MTDFSESRNDSINSELVPIISIANQKTLSSVLVVDNLEAVDPWGIEPQRL